MNDTPIRLVLSDEQLDLICTVARDSWATAVVETFKCFGLDLTSEDGGPVKPGDYAIPNEQWQRIATACGVDVPSDVPGLARVNHMLDWMNYGPGGYEPERPGDGPEVDEREPDEDCPSYDDRGPRDFEHAPDCQGSCCRFGRSEHERLTGGVR